MNREIKFRAWNGKEMLTMPIATNFGISRFFGMLDVNTPESSIMQYTGLKDKNGKEIYESDFVKVNSRIRLIEWRNSMFCCKGTEYHLGTVWFAGGSPEVVGNLYENPELVDITPKNLKVNSIRYKQTHNGLCSTIFSHIKQRSIKRNLELNFDKAWLKEFILSHSDFIRLYSDWKVSNFHKNTRPSIDRIDPIKGYLKSNIQLITYSENRSKGDKEKLILWGKPIIQTDMRGLFIAKYSSTKEAAKSTGLNQSLISHVLTGKRNHTGGFKFQFENPNLLQP